MHRYLPVLLLVTGCTFNISSPKLDVASKGVNIGNDAHVSAQVATPEAAPAAPTTPATTAAPVTLAARALAASAAPATPMPSTGLVWDGTRWVDGPLASPTPTPMPSATLDEGMHTGHDHCGVHYVWAGNHVPSPGPACAPMEGIR